MKAKPSPRCFLHVESDNDPQVPTRILGLFMQRGVLPTRFSLKSTRNGGLSIRLETGVGEACTERLALRLRCIPTIRRVDCGFHYRSGSA